MNRMFNITGQVHDHYQDILKRGDDFINEWSNKYPGIVVKINIGQPSGNSIPVTIDIEGDGHSNCEHTTNEAVADWFVAILSNTLTEDIPVLAPPFSQS